MEMALTKSISDDSCESDSSTKEVEQTGNAAWAEVMGKILKKQGPKDTTSVILAKNKETTDENKQIRIEQRERRKQLNKKRKWEEMNYIKPSILDKDYERSLQKIATRGVVQLFNAVKKHQKQLEEKLKGAKTEGKKDQVMKSVSKGEFLDMLKSDIGNVNNTNSKSRSTLNKSTDINPELPSNEKVQKLNSTDDVDETSWKVLRDDFMMGNKLKDWDKHSDNEDA